MWFVNQNIRLVCKNIHIFFAMNKTVCHYLSLVVCYCYSDKNNHTKLASENFVVIIILIFLMNEKCNAYKLDIHK